MTAERQRWVCPKDGAEVIVMKPDQQVPETHDCGTPYTFMERMPVEDAE